MYARTIVTLTALLLPLACADFHEPLLQSLEKRQGGDAFVPGSTIVSSCAANQLQCGSDWCYTPSEGQVCCSEGYPCPNGSFCLTQGYCCPDGDDPETCARANGVTLPAGFNTAPAPVTPTAASTSSVAPPPVTESSTPPPPPPVATPSSSEVAPTPPPPPQSPSTLVTSETVPPVPYPVPSSSSPTLLVTGTGTGAGTGGGVPAPTSSVSLFTGGAGGHVDTRGGLALALGVLGYLI